MHAPAQALEKLKRRLAQHRWLAVVMFNAVLLDASTSKTSSWNPHSGNVCKDAVSQG